MSLVKRVIYKKETVEANRNKRRKRHGVGGRGISWAEMAEIEINRSIGILQHVLCTSFFFSFFAHCSSALSTFWSAWRSRVVPW